MIAKIFETSDHGNTHTKEDLKRLQLMCLKDKIQVTKTRILQEEIGQDACFVGLAVILKKSQTDFKD